MSDEHQRLCEIFWDVQRGLPRQGPGSAESTLKALALCTGFPARLALLDIGCGPGMQTVVLATAFAEGRITAVDIHQEYLNELRERAKAARVMRTVPALRSMASHESAHTSETRNPQRNIKRKMSRSRTESMT